MDNNNYTNYTSTEGYLGREGDFVFRNNNNNNNTTAVVRCNIIIHAYLMAVQTQFYLGGSKDIYYNIFLFYLFIFFIYGNSIGLGPFLPSHAVYYIVCHTCLYSVHFIL